MTGGSKALEPGDVLDFWFTAGPKKWFSRDDNFDTEIDHRFGPAAAAAGRGALDHLADTVNGALSLVIMLDQFTRNLHRNSARTYDFDAKALEIAEQAIAKGFDLELPSHARRWLYMPHMHCEARQVQRRSVELSTRVDDPSHQKYVAHHAGIIEKYGRFPHRNAILGRQSTPQEEEFLAGGGFGG
ncbi:MAG: DUF924 family protein [Alphaproteobacteria bacterium]